MRTTAAANTPFLPPWTRQSVMYGVVPHLFGKRGLPDVTARLDDLKKLGIDALWLSPINSTTPDDFGYAVTDHFGLRADIGSKRDLRTLVDQAHQRGMRVLMDFVPNHTSDEHPAFVDAQKRGPASPTYDWFERTADGKPTNYFDWKNLPNLDYDNPAVRTHMTDAFEYWVREFGIDGFRVDVAWGLKERRPDFFPQLQKRLTAIKPDVVLIAEASARDPYYFKSGFGGAYDWTTQLGQWSWHDVFEDGKLNRPRLRDAVTASTGDATAGGLVMRFLNNNDTGKRFATRHGVDMARVGAALLMTLPGIPVVYTGDEVAAAYEPYQRTRPLSFRGNTDLKDWYRQLIALRRELPALTSDAIGPLKLPRNAGVFGYTRGAADDAQRAHVLLNFSNKPATARLEGPLVDRLTSESFQPAGKETEVPLAPYSARVLTAVK